MSAENVAWQSADTDGVFDPSTYAEGVPFGAMAWLRRERLVVWVEERPVLGWWAWLLAGALARRRRDGDDPAAAVLVVTRWDPEP